MKSDKTPAAEAGRWPLRLACAGLAAALGWVVLSRPPGSAGLTGPALAELPRSGATNPVTAVLLNYRAYDTLLEIAVLLLSVVSVWAAARADEPDPATPRGPLLLGLARVMAPLSLLIAGYILWVGTSKAGGAFQAGALLGGAGVLLVLAHGPGRRLPAPWVGRVAATAGLAVFLGVAVGLLSTGRRLLELPEESAGAWILLIEAAATISIGATLAAAFLGGRLASGAAREERT